jgi:hypothetical protein
MARLGTTDNATPVRDIPQMWSHYGALGRIDRNGVANHADGIAESGNES